MPFAELKATAVVANAPPTAMSQPVRASARRRRLATRTAIPPATAKPSSRAGLAAEARVEQPQRAGVAAEDAAGTGAARPEPAAARSAAERLRAAGLPGDPAEAVVVEHQAPDAVVARARAHGRSAA